MSMFADLVCTIERTQEKYHLTEDQSIELFIEILGCIQWDLDEVDYTNDTWYEDERKATRDLFNKEK